MIFRLVQAIKGVLWMNGTSFLLTPKTERLLSLEGMWRATPHM